MSAQQAAAASTLFGLPFGWGAILAALGTVVTTVFGGGAFGIWLKTRAENRRIGLDGDERLRSEMWKDIEALKLSKEETSRRLTLAETKLVEQSIELGQHRFLLQLVTDELDRVSPGNPVARQVRDMLRGLQREALPSAEEVGPMAEIMARMCKIDVDEEEKD